MRHFWNFKDLKLAEVNFQHLGGARNVTIDFECDFLCCKSLGIALSKRVQFVRSSLF